MSFVYGTDFEKAVWKDTHHLNLPIEHYFYFRGKADEVYGDDGARFWVEGGFAYSGTKCIGMEVFDITKSRRVEFCIMNIDELLGDVWYVKQKVFLPPDFSLDSPTNKWCTLANPYGQTEWPFKPGARIGLNQKKDGSWILRFTFKDLDGVTHYLQGIHDFPLPLGRWFDLAYEVHKHPTDGNIKVWFDNPLDGPPLWDIKGLPLTGEPNKIVVSKIYYETDDTTPHSIYIDDLELWAGRPPTPTSPLAFALITALGTTAGYLTGGPLGAVAGLGSSATLSYLLFRARTPPVLETHCIECGESFMFTTYGVPVWCPYCGEEQIVGRRR